MRSSWETDCRDVPGHPSSKPNINELARELEVSPGSVKRYVDIFVTDGILSVSRVGTSHLLSLNNDDTIVKELKRVYMALLLREAGITRIAENAISLAAYGSIARGSYDERSDIDILCSAMRTMSISASLLRSKHAGDTKCM
ncbi:MAG: nucleotidyltransferase domain-containing protein [Methanolinea sp.]|nr:nucleotidyltransferase domain-containing protein [Methanolinea sp.]